MEASIRLHDVHIEFPVYQGGSRSLKKSLLWRGTGGAVASDANRRVVVKALDGITLELGHGARVGLIGHNGAGKTTLLRVLAGVYEPARGRIAVEGRICSLFDLAFGMNVDATGHDNIILRGLHLGMSRKEITERLPSIAEFTELGPYLDMPLRTYSAGMRTRLAFAVSTSIESEIMLIDEGIMAGDAHFLAKARDRLSGFLGGTSIVVLATHSPELMRSWCDTAIFMRAGTIVGIGPVEEMLQSYRVSAR
jgi:ABC-2 type transport system ATP-binding protein/lipopolysaccharide transport system ATP-binding protein